MPGLSATQTGPKPTFPGPRPERYCAGRHGGANADLLGWLEKEAVEEVVEPELAIIDPHHHLWDLRAQVPWLTIQLRTLPAQAQTLAASYSSATTLS